MRVYNFSRTIQVKKEKFYNIDAVLGVWWDIKSKFDNKLNKTMN